MPHVHVESGGPEGPNSAGLCAPRTLRAGFGRAGLLTTARAFDVHLQRTFQTRAGTAGRVSRRARRDDRGNGVDNPAECTVADTKFVDKCLDGPRGNHLLLVLPEGATNI